MTTYTHDTVPTQFVEANGIRFAYRRFGKTDGVPIVMNIHFRGTMDHWDPAVTDGLAQHREVILFDNAGVGASSGKTPDTIPGMATDAIAFIRRSGSARLTSSAIRLAAKSPRRSRCKRLTWCASWSW